MTTCRTRDLGSGPTRPVPSLGGMSRDERIQAMVIWFSVNFEGPSEHTPYGGQESGFQYIWGGPCNASDELEDAFGARLLRTKLMPL
jgi:hypothetical protein